MDHLFRLDVQRDASAQSLRAATALALVCAHGYFIVRTSRSALLRFVLAAPMFMTLLYVPMMFRPYSVTVVGSLAFTSAWQSCNKVFGLCCNRGSLALPKLTLLQFACFLLLPVYPAKDVFRSQRPGHQESSSKRPVARTSHQTAVAFLAKAAVVGVLAFCTHSFDLPLPAKHFIYCFYVWLFTSMLLDGPAAACWRLIGLPLQASFFEPYKSRSLKEFWGVRYNQIIGALLRDTVYMPVLEGRLVRPITPAATTTTTATSHPLTVTPRVATPAAPAQAAPAACEAEAEAGSSTPTTPTVLSGGSSPVVPGSPEGSPVRRQQPQATELKLVDSAAELHGSGLEGPHGGKAKGLAEQAPAPTTTTSTTATTAAAASSALRRPSEARQALALLATFLVSGFFHEMLFWYMCSASTGTMFVFFTLQCPLMVLESLLAKALPQGLRAWRHLPKLQVALTWATVIGLAELLFWQNVESCGLEYRGMEEARAFVTTYLLPGLQ